MDTETAPLRNEADFEPYTDRRSDAFAECIGAMARAATDEMPETALLRDLHQRLSETRMRIVFAGRFSVGKSTVINCALSRRLMPSDDVAETGVACHLRGDWIERVFVDHLDGHRSTLACTTEEIAKATSLQTVEGPANTALDSISHVEIRLRDFPGGDAWWVDSPGIDSGQETLNAEQAIDAADLVMWVTRSGQLLSITERAAIARHLRRRGPSAVALVVNVFLPRNSGAAAWDSFLASNADPYRQRLRHHIEEMDLPFVWDPPVVYVSAELALDAPMGYGRSGLMALLERHAHVQRRASFALRTSQAAHRLTAAADLVRKKADALRAQNEHRNAARAEREAMIAAANERHAARVQNALRVYIDAITQHARREAQEIANSMDTLTLDRNGGYTERFATAIRAEAARQQDALMERLASIDRGAGFRWHREQGEEGLRAALAFSLCTIDVPATEPEVNWVGPVVGGTLLAIVSLGIGAAAGVAMGSIAAEKAKLRALEQDVIGAKHDAEVSGRVIGLRAEKTIAPAISVILAHSFMEVERVAAPEDDALSALQQQLEGIEAALTLARQLHEAARA